MKNSEHGIVFTPEEIEAFWQELRERQKEIWMLLDAKSGLLTRSDKAKLHKELGLLQKAIESKEKWTP